MIKSLFRINIFTTVFLSVISANALVGLDELTINLYNKNQDVLALEKNIESKQALSGSTNSAYYPTLNIVGGYGQNKTDDLTTAQKGYLGYAEGKFNLFRGFKDQSAGHQKDIDVQISKFELEAQKREIRKDLIEAASAMVYLHKIQLILDEEYKITQVQKQMAAKKVAAGLSSSVDNLEFELRENEIQIEQKQINQQHQEAHQNLLKLFGEEISDSALEKIEFSSAESLVNISHQINIENTPNYKMTELLQAKAEFEKMEVKSDYLPTLDFTYSVGRLTPSEESSVKFNESKYAIQLTIPLFSGLDTYYKTKSAQLMVQSAEKIKRQKLNDVSSGINILKSKISELNALFQINEKKLMNSQKYFDLTLSEYKRGIKNSPDLVSATERLFSSKKKKYELLKDLELSKAKIQNYE